MRSILILGGTTEARLLAGRLGAQADVAVTLSLAGRTRMPVTMPVPVVSGGFGGADGLARWLVERRIDLLIDATHPFAAIMSRNAAEASRQSGVRMIALRRPAWERRPGDRWTDAADPAGAIAALGPNPRRVFLALGRQEAHAANAAPWHDYLVRSVEPIEPRLTVPSARYILDRGPFAQADDLALLRDNGIDAIIAKNSGGAASYGKIAAAHDLGIEVILVARPPAPDVPTLGTVDEAVAAALHALGLTERGE
ncbi:cobalt-precorrin-6A reductase [Sphingomonas sp. YR710]|uniref:cobalt-precorrin-6A reductase n=1 Tax=Sphingomonas sp. YR710 TaxID=1882773 RepID=UPI000B1D2EF6|nr:cobalt-precorrin-6A reductase [Sphingomonas sp. YR710]